MMLYSATAGRVRMPHGRARKLEHAARAAVAFRQTGVQLLT
jgi:hypothetical protein